MTTEPSERNYGDKLGVLAWMFDPEQQKEKELTLSYEIKWPAKREITVSEYGAERIAARRATHPQE